jgi:hypothetical protein
MDIESINYTAENQALSNLCLQYYNETNEERKGLLFVEIQALALKKLRERDVDKK